MRKMLLGLAAAFAAVASAQAGPIAVFGNNASLNSLINSIPGFSAVTVTDAQVATPGFLNGFSAFFYTRAATGFGPNLSVAASNQVRSYVGQAPNNAGNIVLFNSDITDSFAGLQANDPAAQALLRNAVQFAAANGRGFIGEFNGANAALTSNANGITALNLIPGTAGPLNSGAAFDTNFVLTPNGVGHPVTAGVGFPFNPNSVEFGSVFTGVPSQYVLATYANGNPAIIAVAAAAVPEPLSIAVFGGLVAVGGLVARRRMAKVVA